MLEPALLGGRVEEPDRPPHPLGVEPAPRVAEPLAQLRRQRRPRRLRELHRPQACPEEASVGVQELRRSWDGGGGSGSSSSSSGRHCLSLGCLVTLSREVFGAPELHVSWCQDEISRYMYTTPYCVHRRFNGPLNPFRALDQFPGARTMAVTTVSKPLLDLFCPSKTSVSERKSPVQTYGELRMNY